MFDRINKFSLSHSCVLLLIYCTSGIWFQRLKSALKVNCYSICLFKKFINLLINLMYLKNDGSEIDF